MSVLPENLLYPLGIKYIAFFLLSSILSCLEVVMPAAQTISLRMQDKHKELIDCAAESCSKSRTDFIVDSALKKARDMLSEKTHFVLTPKQWDEFVKTLDRPPTDNPGLDRLMRTVPPWEAR